MKRRSKNKQQGYVALLSALIITFIGIAVGTSLVLSGLGSSRTSFASEQSNQAKGLANACAEEALQLIRDTGSGSFSMGQGSCTYTVTSTGGQNRTIVISGTVSGVVRRATIAITQITPTITISSWQEVP
jgi:hypothetical protein